MPSWPSPAAVYHGNLFCGTHRASKTGGHKILLPSALCGWIEFPYGTVSETGECSGYRRQLEMYVSSRERQPQICHLSCALCASVSETENVLQKLRRRRQSDMYRYVRICTALKGVL